MSEIPKAKLSELINTLEFHSEESRICYDRYNAEVVVIGNNIFRALEENDEEYLQNIPDWQKEQVPLARAILEDEEKRFIGAPDPLEFNEYTQMEEFSLLVADQDASEKLYYALKGQGAFLRFKDTLGELGLQDEWYRYREIAMKEFVTDWCDANGIPFDDDTVERSANVDCEKSAGILPTKGKLTKSLLQERFADKEKES